MEYLKTDNPVTIRYILHRADTRGHDRHGRPGTRRTFGFADYYDPRRIRCGTMQVLNDDTVTPGTGFGMHSHDNMVIVSIPLEDHLRHGDGMGNT